MPRPFKGKIELDIRDSVSDWDAFLTGSAPDGAANVLVVLYDDTASPHGYSPGRWSGRGGAWAASRCCARSR